MTNLRVDLIRFKMRNQKTSHEAGFLMAYSTALAPKRSFFVVYVVLNVTVAECVRRVGTRSLLTPIVLTYLPCLVSTREESLKHPICHGMSGMFWLPKNLD